MDLNAYQFETGRTARYPRDRTELPLGIIYCALKLAGEAGEYSDKVGKIIRDSGGVISDEVRHALILELGDVLWYVARSAEELGIPLEDVANLNLHKLASRLERNRLSGSGDHR